MFYLNDSQTYSLIYKTIRYNYLFIAWRHQSTNIISSSSLFDNAFSTRPPKIRHPSVSYNSQVFVRPKNNTDVFTDGSTTVQHFNKNHRKKRLLESLGNDDDYEYTQDKLPQTHNKKISHKTYEHPLGSKQIRIGGSFDVSGIREEEEKQLNVDRRQAFYDQTEKGFIENVFKNTHQSHIDLKQKQIQKETKHFLARASSSSYPLSNNHSDHTMNKANNQTHNSNNTKYKVGDCVPSQACMNEPLNANENCDFQTSLEGIGLFPLNKTKLCNRLPTTTITGFQSSRARQEDLSECLKKKKKLGQELGTDDAFTHDELYKSTSRPKKKQTLKMDIKTNNNLCQLEPLSVHKVFDSLSDNSLMLSTFDEAKQLVQRENKTTLTYKQTDTESGHDAIRQTKDTPQYDLKKSCHVYKDILNIDNSSEKKLICPSLLVNLPEAFQCHQDIMKCRTSDTLLRLIEQHHCRNFHPFNCVTALTRLAKFSNGLQLKYDPRLTLLLNSIQNHLPDLTGNGLCNIFWALTRMGLTPKFLPDVIRLCHEQISGLSLQELSTVLNSLKRLSFLTNEMCLFKERLVNTISDRLNEKSTIADICSITIGIGVMKIDNPDLIYKLSQIVQKRLFEFTSDDFASILWSFSRLHSVDNKRPLFELIRQRLQDIIETARVESLISYCWAFGTTCTGSHDFFKFCLSPILRTYLHALDVKALTTISWAYAKNDVIDDDFMTDILFYLNTKISECTASQISKLCWAFKKLNLTHNTFFNDLAAFSLKLLPTFDSCDIPTVMLGFSHLSVKQDTIFHSLWDEASYHIDIYKEYQLLGLLMGLTQSRQWDLKTELQEIMLIDSPILTLPETSFPPIKKYLLRLQTAVSTLTFGQHYQILSCISAIRQLPIVPAFGVNPFTDVIELTTEHMLEYVKKSWTVSETQYINVLYYLQSLRIRNDTFIEHWLSHLGLMLKEFNFQQVFDLLKAIESGGPHSLPFRLFLMHLHRRHSVRFSIQRVLHQCPPAESNSLNILIHSVWYLAMFGIEGDAAEKWYEATYDRLSSINEPSLTLPLFSKLLLAYTQLDRYHPWVRTQLIQFLNKKYSVNHSNNSIGTCDTTMIQPHTREHPTSLVVHDHDKDGGLDCEYTVLVKELRQALTQKPIKVVTGVTYPQDPVCLREIFLKNQLQKEYSDSFLLLAWVCLAQGGELKGRFILPLMEDAVSLRVAGTTLRYHLFAQQICLFLDKTWNICSNPKKKQIVETDLTNHSGTRPSKALCDFTRHTINFLRDDLNVNRLGGNGASHVKNTAAPETEMRLSLYKIGDFAYTNWLSTTLSTEMKIRHKTYYLIKKIYSVPIAFPDKYHLIDVLDFSDVKTPTAKPLRSSTLRQQQLAEIGWIVHSIHLGELYNCVSNNTLTKYLGEMLLPVFPECNKFLQFNEGTADAQATRMGDDLQACRQQIITNLVTSDKHQNENSLLSEGGTCRNNFKSGETHNVVSDSCARQLTALKELHNAQRQLLADKLFVDKNAAEWFKRAKNVVFSYNSETRKRQRLEGRHHHSPRLKNGQITFNSDPSIGTAASPGLRSMHQTRTSSSSDVITSADRSIDLNHTATGSTPLSTICKKRRTLPSLVQNGDSPFPSIVSTSWSVYDEGGYDYDGLSGNGMGATCVSTSRKSGTSSVVSASHGRQSHNNQKGSTIKGTGNSERSRSAKNSESSHSASSQDPSLIATNNFLSSTEGLIIKLGSQKGRPRKSTGGSSKNSYPEQQSDAPIVNSTPNSNNSSSSLYGVCKDADIAVQNDYASAEDYICPICKKSENENPSMVACDSCDKWYHCLCVGFIDDANAAEKAFYCPNCRDAYADTS